MVGFGRCGLAKESIGLPASPTRICLFYHLKALATGDRFNDFLMPPVPTEPYGSTYSSLLLRRSAIASSLTVRKPLAGNYPLNEISIMKC